MPARDRRRGRSEWEREERETRSLAVRKKQQTLEGVTRPASGSERRDKSATAQSGGSEGGGKEPDEEMDEATDEEMEEVIDEELGTDREPASKKRKMADSTCQCRVSDFLLIEKLSRTNRAVLPVWLRIWRESMLYESCSWQTRISQKLRVISHTCALSTGGALAVI